MVDTSLVVVMVFTLFDTTISNNMIYTNWVIRKTVFGVPNKSDKIRAVQVTTTTEDG